jgi:KUP system potassium uptake protein
VPLPELVAMLEKSPPHRVKGTAVFLTSDPATAPAALLHNLKHNKVLHEKNVVLTVRTADTPRVRDEDRVQIASIGDSFWKVVMTYGYMETPNFPRGLAILRKLGFKFDIMATSFFLSRRSIRPAAHSGHAALAGQALHRPRRPPQPTPPTSSRSRPAAWSRWGRR